VISGLLNNDNCPTYEFFRSRTGLSADDHANVHFVIADTKVRRDDSDAAPVCEMISAKGGRQP
jgi:hypothetical protein